VSSFSECQRRVFVWVHNAMKTAMILCRSLLILCLIAVAAFSYFFEVLVRRLLLVRGVRRERKTKKI